MQQSGPNENVNGITCESDTSVTTIANAQLPCHADCHAETLEATQNVQAHCQEIEQVLCSKTPQGLQMDCTCASLSCQAANLSCAKVYLRNMDTVHLHEFELSSCNHAVAQWTPGRLA